MAQFTTLLDVKRYLSIKDGNTDQDAILGDLIEGASAAVNNYLNRDIMLSDRADSMDGNGKDAMFMRHWPVVSVTSVKVNGQSIPAAPDGYSTTPGFRVEDPMLILQGYRFTRGRRNVEVVYSAGYETIPDELKAIVTETVALRYKERDWTGYSSKSLAGETVAFTLADFSRNAKGVLNSYRRVVFS